MSFLKTSILIGGSNLLKLTLGLITNKVFAVFLGVDGYAVLANMQNLIAIYSRSCSASIETGLIKVIAENSLSLDKQKQAFRAALYIYIVMSTISLIAIFTTYTFWKNIVFSSYTSHENDCILSLILISGPCFGIASILTAKANGFKKVSAFAKANILGSVIGLIFSLVFIPDHGLTGALLSILSSQITVFLFIAYSFLKEKSFSFLDFLPRFNRKISIEYLSFSAMTFISILTSSLLMIALRNHVSDEFSLEEAGAWQGVWKLSELINNLVFSAVSFYFLPRFAEEKNISKLKGDIGKFILTIFPLYFFICIGSLLFSTDILELVFSSEFVIAAELLFWQFIGNSIQICAWLLGSLIVLRKMNKAHFLIQNISVLVVYILSVIYSSKYGLIGMAYAFILGNIILLIANASVIWLRNKKRG